MTFIPLLYHSSIMQRQGETGKRATGQQKHWRANIMAKKQVGVAQIGESGYTKHKPKRTFSILFS